MSNNPSANRSLRRAANEAHESFEVRPTTLVSYRSEGRLLIIGSAARVAEALEALSDGLQTHALLVDACPPQLAERLRAGRIGWLERAGSVAVSGYLGAFRVTAEFDGKIVEINPLLLSRDIHLDLILDLQDAPSIPLPVPPIGYCAPRAGEDRLRAALERLAELVGEFDKPKFFEHKPEICAHSASRIEGCRACLEVCAAGAITSQDFQITVNPYLCQGCGDCSTVCPAGAMNYLYPRRGDTLNRLRAMLDAWFSADGQAPVLLLYDSEEGEAWMARHRDELPAGFLPYPVEALSAAGMEIWLSALAYGCEQVVLLAVGELTEMTARSLNEQVGFAGELLVGMGYEPFCIRLTRPEGNIVELPTDAPLSVAPPTREGRWGRPKESRDSSFDCPHPNLPPWGEGVTNADAGSNSTALKPESLAEREARPESSERTRARFAGDDDKRTVIRVAIEHLYRYAPKPCEAAPLSVGAPFGEIRVDTSRCTLCMSCVSICPEQALADGGDLPNLKFIEANCVQCRLCRKACPENAIELTPRYLFDQNEARRARLLHEEDVFACVGCGKPFATASMIKTITGRLQGHSLFQGDKLRRLQMCEACRVKSMFSDRGRKP
jgi:ferredoxin